MSVPLSFKKTNDCKLKIEAFSNEKSDEVLKSLGSKIDTYTKVGEQ